MNYIKYLADARLINMVYPKGEEFPKKPSKLMMHNTNLMYSIYPVKVEEYKGDKGASFKVDNGLHFAYLRRRVQGSKNNPNVYYALPKFELGTLEIGDPHYGFSPLALRDKQNRIFITWMN